MVMPGESRTLREIEDQLSEADPGLAAMFTGFEADPGRAREGARRGRAGYAARMLFLWVLLALCVTMVILMAVK
jgi:hypothetical protein